MPPIGVGLKVEVFAYENDYQQATLRVLTAPYRFEATEFAALKPSVNLAGLASFFDSGIVLDGAHVSRGDGLILYGRASRPQTLRGYPLSLSDLAVVYRAVFHAGDNEAFVSLDPHVDPTKVTVNFGGLLEDTRVGSVVLESDKRFKTITCGLDPNTYEDVRADAKTISGFMTGAERDIRFDPNKRVGEWVGTRFWYYPDSIKVESDLRYEYAFIANPHFAADAERSREDYQSPEEFEKKKRAQLSPSIRDSIAHLNDNYDSYADVYHELKELSTVARLMGVCVWLQKAGCDWLDLDSLLAVDVPSCATERERTQLIAATVAARTLKGISGADGESVTARVSYLSPVLEVRVMDFFGSVTNLAKYLCSVHNQSSDDWVRYRDAARDVWNERGKDSVKSLVKTKSDLQCLASFAGIGIKAPVPPEVASIESKIESAQAETTLYEVKIDALKRTMSRADGYGYDALVDRHNELVEKYERARQEHNELVERYNGLDLEYPIITEIGGGVSMEPSHFTISTSPSREYDTFRRNAENARPAGLEAPYDGALIRSSGKAEPYVSSYSISADRWRADVDEPFRRHVSTGDEQYWFKRTDADKSWQDVMHTRDGTIQERVVQQSAGTITIARTEQGKEVPRVIVGRRVGTDRIEFTVSTRTDVRVPRQAPDWW